MPSILVDAGIIVAALNRNDRFHFVALELIADYEGRLLTTWPVIAEACALVAETRQADVLAWAEQSDTEIVSIDDGLAFMRRMMNDDRDLPLRLRRRLARIAAAWRTSVRRDLDD